MFQFKNLYLMLFLICFSLPSSRPVIHFLTSMTFDPERIPVFQNNSIVTAKLCFDTISALPVSQQGNKWELWSDWNQQPYAVLGNSALRTISGTTNKGLWKSCSVCTVIRSLHGGFGCENGEQESAVWRWEHDDEREAAGQREHVCWAAASHAGRWHWSDSTEHTIQGMSREPNGENDPKK